MPTNSRSRVLRKRRRDKSARERNEFSHGRAPHDFGLLSECRQRPGIALIRIALIGPLLRFVRDRLTSSAADGRQSTKLYFVALLIAAIAMLRGLHGPPPLIGQRRPRCGFRPRPRPLACRADRPRNIGLRDSDRAAAHDCVSWAFMAKPSINSTLTIKFSVRHAIERFHHPRDQ